MSLLRGPGRGRAFFRFLLGAGWVVVVYYLSAIAAHGFSRGTAFPLIRNIFAIFLLIVGYGYMEMAWDNRRTPLKAMGLVKRPGAAREFALGAALGWGMVATVILVAALGGTLYVQLSGSPHVWGRLGLGILAVATSTLAAEIAFRGYPFQKLVEASGPLTATILSGIFFGLLRMEVPGATPTAMWISAVAAVLLSVAYLRTHALWLCWGLHFAWVASIGILFGQPLAHSRHASSVIRTYVDGPTWLTGGEFGPEASLVALIVLWIGLYVLIRITHDLARKYGQPELKPAGIPMGSPMGPIEQTAPMNLDRPMPPPSRPDGTAPVQIPPVPEPSKPAMAQTVPIQASSAEKKFLNPVSNVEPQNSPELQNPMDRQNPIDLQNPMEQENPMELENSKEPSSSVSSAEPSGADAAQKPKTAP